MRSEIGLPKGNNEVYPVRLHTGESQYIHLLHEMYEHVKMNMCAKNIYLMGRERGARGTSRIVPAQREVRRLGRFRVVVIRLAGLSGRGGQVG